MKHLKIRSKPVINLICISGEKYCNIMLVSLLLAQSLFLSPLIFTNLTSPRNSSQIKKSMSGNTLGNIPLVGKEGEGFLCSARTLLTKTEGEEAGAAENSFVFRSLRETLEAKTRRVQQPPFTFYSSLNHSCIQQKPDRRCS